METIYRGNAMKRLTFGLLLIVLLAGCGETQTQIVKETVIVEQTTVVEKIKVVTATPRPTPRATATPRATPTPKPAEVGTRKNPYPFNTEVSLIQSDKLKFKVTVYEVIRGEQAYQMAKAANQFNDPPVPGTDFVIVKVRINYDGEDQGILDLDESGVGVVTNGRYVPSYQMQGKPCCMEPKFDFELFQGATAEGNIILIAASDDENPLMVWGGADGLYFALK